MVITDLTSIHQKYSIIYCDPAWVYKTYSDKGKGKSPEQHYRCMPIEEMEKLPVYDIAAQDACLFMWSIDTHIPQCLALAAHWGFTYSTKAFEWVKTTKPPEWDGTLLTKARFHFGMGHWTRANSETCFLFTKGKPKRVARNVRRLVCSEVREHSRKPDRIRNDILRLCGDLPRIELFARTTDEG